MLVTHLHYATDHFSVLAVPERGDDVSWETVAPERRQKQQWGGSVPGKGHMVLIGFACVHK